ncbi:hypothetical protein HMSSN036_55280 [Paenibacillus macerans]|nr:hypothetical protein HMSSN036_55280 [Paenibacillus macerans]
MQMDRKVSEILNTYYASEPSVESVQLVTGYYSFGGTAILTSRPTFVSVKPDKLHASKLYRDTLRADGKLIWIPTYDLPSSLTKRNSETWIRGTVMFSPPPNC